MTCVSEYSEVRHETTPLLCGDQRCLTNMRRSRGRCPKMTPTPPLLPLRHWDPSWITPTNRCYKLYLTHWTIFLLCEDTYNQAVYRWGGELGGVGVFLAWLGTSSCSWRWPAGPCRWGGYPCCPAPGPRPGTRTSCRRSCPPAARTQPARGQFTIIVLHISLH